MRDRGSVVIVEDNRVALIQSIRDNSVYYVFPGGGIEKGETPEGAAKRVALEEYTDKERNRGIYLPMWVDIIKIPSIDIKPKEVALKIQSLFK